jgi:hypothetical protein
MFHQKHKQIDNIASSPKLTLERVLSYIKDQNNICNSASVNNPVQNKPDLTSIPDNDMAEDTSQPLERNNIRQLINLPAKLNSIFADYITQMSRIGVLKYMNDASNKYNISLLVSILTCIVPDFITKPINTQQEYACQLTNNLIKYVNINYRTNNYKIFGFNQTALISQLSQYLNTKIILRILSDYLSVNLYLININQTSILVPNKIDGMKQNILLLLLEDEFIEPVIFMQCKLHPHNNIIFGHIANNHFTYLFDQDKNISPSDRSDNEIIECSDEDDNPDGDNNTDHVANNLIADISDMENTSRITKHDRPSKELPIIPNLYNKFKLAELQFLVQKINIPINIVNPKTLKEKNKTRAELITDIDGYLAESRT